MLPPTTRRCQHIQTTRFYSIWALRSAPRAGHTWKSAVQSLRTRVNVPSQRLCSGRELCVLPAWRWPMPSLLKEQIWQLPMQRFSSRSLSWFTSSLLCVAGVPLAARRLRGRLFIPGQVQGFMPELCPAASQCSPLPESRGRLLAASSPFPARKLLLVKFSPRFPSLGCIVRNVLPTPGPSPSLRACLLPACISAWHQIPPGISELISKHH